MWVAGQPIYEVESGYTTPGAFGGGTSHPGLASGVATTCHPRQVFWGVASLRGRLLVGGHPRVLFFFNNLIFFFFFFFFKKKNEIFLVILIRFQLKYMNSYQTKEYK
jgi:hypothetical protein